MTEKNEDYYTKQINKLTKEFKKKPYSKKKFLDKQIKLMEECLTLKSLSLKKKFEIKQGLQFCKMTRKML